MKEALGPNMARTLVGHNYDPGKVYELLTGSNGFSLVITDKETGEREVSTLLPEPVDADRLTLMPDKKPFKGVDWAFIVLSLLIVCTVFTIGGVILWRSGTLSSVLPWLQGLMGST
jgi:hypothetical protein